MTEQGPPIGTRCPECGKGQIVALTRTEEFDFDLGEETVKVRAENVPVLNCDHCGEVMSGPEAAKVRHEAVCRAAGFLTPPEYKSIREELGWSQQRLADLTGFGVATVSRSERGRLLPNRSYNTVLLAIRDCPPFRECLERLHESRSGKREANPASDNGAAPAASKQEEPRPTSDNGPARSSKLADQGNPSPVKTTSIDGGN